MSEIEKVDIPLTVPKETAEAMVQDLKETGSIDLTVRETNCPSLIEQIEWQLENNEHLLKFVEKYNQNNPKENNE